MAHHGPHGPGHGSHAHAHDAVLLAPWVNEVLAQAGTPADLGARSVEFARSQQRAFSTCMDELLTQSAVHDASLTQIMGRVWGATTGLLESTIGNYQQQLALTHRAQKELQSILSQMKVHSSKSRYELRRMRLELAQSKSIQERTVAELVSLQTAVEDLELDNGRIRALMVGEGGGEGSGSGDEGGESGDGGSDDDVALAPWKKHRKEPGALSRGIDDLVVHMEKEDLKQARYMGDLDFHVNQLQMRIQAESYKVRGVGWGGGEKGSREGAEAERGAEREGGE